MRALPHLGLALLVAALGPTPVAAQREMNVQRFSPAPDGDGFLGITGTRTPGPWRWNAALWLHYTHRPLTARLPDGTSIALVGERFEGDLLVQVGLLGRFALVVDAPVVVWQEGSPRVTDGGPGLQSVAIRDPRIALRARIVGEDATQERERHEGEGVAIQIAGTVPIGHEQAFAGEGAPQLEAQILGDFHLLDFGLGGVLGYRHRFAEPRVLGVLFRNELFFGVAIQVPAYVIDDVVGITEIMVTTDAENAFGYEASTAVEWLLGFRGRLRDLELTLAGGTGLTSGVGTSTFRLALGVSFAPRVHDRDRDGIVDDVDSCPTLPEDFDGFVDDDGCPDPDNDGDLVPDLDDRCPNEPAELGRDLDDDGCNDPHLDADGDGVEDDQDRCPESREDSDGHADEDGCPDLDDDGDGVPDTADACRTEPEDLDGISDEDGCPDLDDDGDGVLQGEDRCEGEPEDRDGWQDEDGCPDPDDDRDGVLDADDRCRDAAETINGRADDDGCPDRGGRALWRRAGTPGRPDLLLEGAIRFAADGTIARLSRGAVDQLARHLLAAWGTRVRIAIGRGSEASVAGLRAALIERGVPEARIEVVADPSVRGVRASAVNDAPPLESTSEVEAQPTDANSGR
jgi:hypothetical protein